MIGKSRCHDGFMNVINHVMSDNILIMQILNVEKERLISSLKNVVKILIRIQMIYNVTLNDHGNVCNYHTIYTVLLIITFIILMGSASIYLYWHTIKIVLINSIINVQMLKYDRIDNSEVTDVNNTHTSKDMIIVIVGIFRQKFSVWTISLQLVPCFNAKAINLILKLLSLILLKKVIKELICGAWTIIML